MLLRPLLRPLHWAAPLLGSVLLLALAGCSGETEHSGVRGVSDTEIILGMHTDLSGPAAMVGFGSSSGARMKFEEINARGGIHGRQIRLIVEDSQYQVPRAIQAANKLVRRDGIFAMIGSIGTPMNNAVMPMLFEHGVPNLFPATGARSMSEPFHHLQFVALDQYYAQVRATLRHFITQQGYKVPCVMYQDSEFGQEILDAARDEIQHLGLELASESAHKPTDTEFTTSVMRLRNAGCDLVALGTIHRDTILIAEAARKLDWAGVQWVGHSANYHQAVAELESGATEGLATFMQIKAWNADDPDADPAIGEWMSRYRDRFKQDAEFAALESYRVAGILEHALQRAGRDLTADGLVAALESMTEFHDLFGGLSRFGPDDHSAPARAWLTVVRDGRWVTVPESIEY